MLNWNLQRNETNNIQVRELFRDFAEVFLDNYEQNWIITSRMVLVRMLVPL